MHPSSMRFQLTVWNVLVLMVILFVCGVALLFQMQSYLLRGIDQELQDRVHPMLFPPRGPQPPNPPPNGIASDQPFGGPPPGPFGPLGGPDQGPPPPPRRPADIRVLTTHGIDPGAGGLKPFDEGAFLASLSGETISTTILRDKGHWRIYSAPRHGPDGSVNGVVQAEQPLAPMQTEIADLIRTLLTLIPLGMIAAGVGGAFLTGRSLRPVQRMATEVDRIQAEDLGRRLPAAGNDEFSRLAKTVNSMLCRLQSAFEEQRRFTMDASHELKTPLTIIKAKTSVALIKQRPADAYRSVIETVDQAADRMSDIVQDLLLLAHADSGQLGRDRQMVLASDLIKGALNGVWNENGPPIKTKVYGPELEILCDPGQLTRALRNIVENAVQHTPPSGCVQIGASALSGGVEITIADDGEGIAVEHLPHLTERFYRVDTARTRQTGGSGLGLAICKSIVEANGGHLEIDSALGEGTTIRLWLPSRSS